VSHFNIADYLGPKSDVISFTRLTIREQYGNINGRVKQRWTQELKSLMDDGVQYLGGFVLQAVPLSQLLSRSCKMLCLSAGWEI
jgi:hypothetical protein